MPERIQLRRSNGWRMPPNTVKVDRSTRWGNPFRVGTEGVPDAAAAVRLFSRLLEMQDQIAADHKWFVFTNGRLIADLGGKNLACWCRPGEPCHADLLIRAANQLEQSQP